MTSLHGGDIYRNRIEIDFSVSLNPLGCPESVMEALKKAVNHASEYPDPEQIRAKQALSKAYGICPEQILCASGASELFMAITAAVSPKKALVLAPSFYGYEHALKSIPECEIRRHYIKKENGFEITSDILDDLTSELDIFFLCNPNNPTGRAVPEKLLLQIIKTCEEKEITLVLDECFQELSEGVRSMLQKAPESKYLIVVKAFTKLFSIPGVRCGFAVSSEENKDAIRAHLPEWNLNVFSEEAIVAGCRVLNASENVANFLAESGNMICTEKEYLTKKLSDFGFEIFPSDTCFFMIHTVEPLYEELLSSGILIRDCSNFEGLGKGYYRITVKQHEYNERLIKELQWKSNM